jgi:hypothetical protein
MAKPTEAQKAALMAELAKIDPKLEGARALVDARLSCRSILKGDPEEVQIETTRQRFSTGSGTITEAEANQIIEIVKAKLLREGVAAARDRRVTRGGSADVQGAPGTGAALPAR